MKTTTIDALGGHAGATVCLAGWVCGVRGGGKVKFLQVRDGTGRCQCVVEAGTTEAFAVAAALSLESALRVTGTVRLDERAVGGCELSVTALEVLHAAAEYPISRKAHGVDFLMSHRHLWLRSRRPTAILRIRHTLIRACRAFFDERGFTLIDTPILVPGAGEDTQTLFPVEYFGETASLAQTGQLYLESACMALGKVYCFGPTFRAEKSKTRRHLTEFWMVEPEVAFADLDAIIDLAEGLVCHLVETVLAQHEAELVTLERDLAALRRIARPFPRLTYAEAVERLQAPGARAAEDDAAGAPIEWGHDLGAADETVLSRQFDQPLFVTHYPRAAKAFYMKASAADERVVNNMDLLAPEGYGEIIGGSQREDDLAVLQARMREKGLEPSDYEWYLDLRRYGSVPHGGFGLGIERTIAWICGLTHVREAIPFPRTMGRLHP